MNPLACPVCATPYEAGATICAFCGVSLVEPEPKPAAKPRTRAKSAPKSTPQPEARADTPPSPAPVEAIELPAKEPPPAPAQIVEPIAGETPLPTPVEIVEPVADEAPSPAPVEPDAVDAIAVAEPEPATPDTAETPAIPGDSEPSAAPPHGTQSPSFARARLAASAAQRRLQRIEWGIVAGLAALLLVQLVASDFDQLAANSTTRPWLQSACNVLRCDLPLWREPQSLHLLQRDVQANPRRPGTLRISASFRNEARWTQPWPRLRVTLSDTDGHAIAARDFAADEYLGAKPTTNGIASGQVASVAFDVADPSPRVTAFTFEFR